VPVVAISVDRLNQLLGKPYPMDELVEALEQLGCDVEDTADLGLFRCPACQTPNDRLDHEEAPRRCDFCGMESEEPFPKFAVDRVIRLDLLADRPDLFDAGGLSRALKGYLGHEQGLSTFALREGDVSVDVDAVLSQENTFRPFICCAVVAVPPLEYGSLREIMRLQENLHWGIGRDRKLASIGVYDLDTIKPPIRYSTVDPDDFRFNPLGMPGSGMTPRQILKEHPKGAAYAHLMDKYTRYPILVDAAEQVLSMPPIINSDETKCKLGTSRLFIDVTGITRDAVVNALNTLVSALLEVGGKAESVKMNFPDRKEITPDLSPRRITIDYEEAKRWLGLDLTRDEFMQVLSKMRLNVTPAGRAYEVQYPVFRTDIRHEVDLFEDLAIGYGYKNIPMRMIPSMTLGRSRPEEKISQIARETALGLGFSEILSLNLQSEERHFTKFRMEPGDRHVVVENPKTIDQKIVRTHMMTGIMESFRKNRRKTMPQRLFEIGNVIHLHPKRETGVEEYRHVVLGIIGPETGYAQIRSILDSLLRELGRQGEYRMIEHPAFSTGRCAEVTHPDGLWAVLGEIHPEVLSLFGLAYPVALCELRIIRVV